MPTGFTYATFSTALAALMVVDTTNDADWNTFLPNIIDGAELRILRELDPQCARKSEIASFGGQATPALVLPVGLNCRLVTPSDLVVARELGYYTPVGATGNTGGTWNQLLQRDASFLREAYPDRTVQAAPVYWAITDQSELRVAPTPDAAYYVEMFMTYRPATLSATQTTTYLSLNYPDLFLYAAAVVGAGFLKNYGAASTDAQVAVSWERMYTTYLAAAIQEEARRKGQQIADNSASAAA